MAVSTIDPNGLNVGQLGGDRNLLINGDFQISQRGNYTSAFSYTNNTYYLDRWIGSLGGVTATLQDIGRKVKLVATSSATGTMRLIQKIELSTMNKFNSQTVIASAKVKSNSSQARIGFYADGYIVPTGNTTHTGDETEQTLTAIITVPSSTLTVEFDVFVGLQGANAGDTVSITSGDYVEITEVQLEVGDTATDFEYESYGTTLQKCKRYYQKFGNLGGYDVVAFAGIAPYTTQVQAATPLSPEMRVTPSLSLANIAAADTVNPQVAVTSAAVNSGTHNNKIAWVAYYTSGSLTAFRPYYLRVDGTSTGYVAFDAEL